MNTESAKVTMEDLKKIRFLEGYSDDQLNTILQMCTLKEFRVKDILFEQYDELKDVCYSA